MKKPIFIAEVKTKSPFNPNYSGLAQIEPWNLAQEKGDWVSIHTSADFGGSFKWLNWCCKHILNNKPILAKGFHKTDDEIQKCLDLGADYVLVVDRIPAEKYLDKTLLEFSNFCDGTFEMANLLYSKAKFVHNLRNLKTGLLKKYNEFPKLRSQFKKTWLCQASGIRAPWMVDSRADAFIVGTYLDEFCKILL